jgi:rhodanese-related sulfurtransferase
MPNLSVNEFSRIITQDDVVILDVRTPEEFFEGFIEGAQHLDFYRVDFESEINALDKELKYAVYCRSGKRSGKAIEIMQKAAFHNLFNLDGGIIEWVGAGKPLTLTGPDF